MAEPSLSRDQVENLLEALAEGQIDLDGGQTESYPPQQLDLGPIQGELEWWLQETARMLENWLIVHVSDQFRCTLRGMVPRSGFTGNETAGLALIGTEDDREPFLSVWDMPLVDALISGMLGFDFTAQVPIAGDEERKLTEIDLRLVRRAANGLSDALTYGWPRNHDTSFTVLAASSDVASLPGDHSARPSMAARFEVFLGPDVLGGIEFRMPGWVAKLLRSHTEQGDPVADGSQEMKDSLSWLNVDLEAFVSVGEFTLDEILSLQVGDELMLPTNPTATLRAGDVDTVHGIPGIIEEHWAISVKSVEESVK